MSKKSEIEEKIDSLTLDGQFKEVFTEEKIEEIEENIYSIFKKILSVGAILIFTGVPIIHLFTMEVSNEYYIDVVMASVLAIPVSFYLSAYLLMCFSFLRKDLIEVSRLKREIKQGKTKIEISSKNNSIELDIEKNTLAKKSDPKKNKDRKIPAPNYSFKKKPESKKTTVNPLYKHKKNKVYPIRQF